MYLILKKEFIIYMRLKPFSNKQMRARRIRLTNAKFVSPKRNKFVGPSQKMPGLKLDKFIFQL